jgi:hypothetical protein
MVEQSALARQLPYSVAQGPSSAQATQSPSHCDVLAHEEAPPVPPVVAVLPPAPVAPEPVLVEGVPQQSPVPAAIKNRMCHRMRAT